MKTYWLLGEKGEEGEKEQGEKDPDIGMEAENRPSPPPPPPSNHPVEASTQTSRSSSEEMRPKRNSSR